MSLLYGNAERSFEGTLTGLAGIEVGLVSFASSFDRCSRAFCCRLHHKNSPSNLRSSRFLAPLVEGD